MPTEGIMNHRNCNHSKQHKVQLKQEKGQGRQLLFGVPKITSAITDLKHHELWSHELKDQGIARYAEVLSMLE